MYASAESLEVAPHRAYRRLVVFRPARVLVSLLLVAGLELLLIRHLAEIVRVFGLTTFALVRFVGTPASLGSDRFLGIELFPLVFGSIPPLSYGTVLLWLAGSVAGIAGLGRWRRLPTPVRYLLVYNLLLLAASAFYLLYAGHLGYDAEEFSRLYLRTVVTMWLVTPVFMGVMSLILPFSPLQRVLLVTLSLCYDTLLSAVRYAVFVWCLTHLGAVVMANLYLFLGPLLDVVYFVGIFTLLVFALGRRVERKAEYRA